MNTNGGSNANHENRCKNNPNRVGVSQKRIDSLKNRKIKNGYMKARAEGKPIPPNPQKGKKLGPSAPKSEAGLEAIRNSAISRGLGGVRQSKRIRYNNKVLGSSYELQVVKDLDRNRIRWDTCRRFKYIDPTGKIRTYTPDIFLIDYGIYLDPKNDFLINNPNPSLGFRDIDKIRWVELQNSISVIILNKNELQWEVIFDKIVDLIL